MILFSHLGLQIFNCVHVCPISPYQTEIWADREVPRGKGGVNKVLYREAHPRRPTPYPDYMPFQAKNGYHFEYFLLTNGTPFTQWNPFPFIYLKPKKGTPFGWSLSMSAIVGSTPSPTGESNGYAVVCHGNRKLKMCRCREPVLTLEPR